MPLDLAEFTVHSDSRGSLIALESEKEIPFTIKRVYYIFGVRSGERRGFHAHKKLKQVMTCVSGGCKVLFDDGLGHKTIVTLDTPKKAVVVSGTYWREMYDFSPNAVLMVFVSEKYDESDYIRDYDSFLAYASGLKKPER